ncbi:MAG TPA: threonylcarbamoyl-AMP synthase [Actinobacteria bacterium]|jgi:L-threonylcarbamoyladenylate synthase|nr:threonylcarbamoyl-AMP synthase [Actinomycetota bacterium]
MTQRIECSSGIRREQAVSTALAAVRRGDLVIIPTESVYAIATDAFSERGVAALREAKGYDDAVPLPLMVGGRSMVAGIAARISDDARCLMESFWPGALTVLLQPQPTLAWSLAPGAPLAVRMPLHPVALSLLAATGPLVVTTANVPGLAAPMDVDDAVAQLGHVAALALDAGSLGGTTALASTVVDTTVEPPRVVRDGAISVDELRQRCPGVIPSDGAPTA